MMNIPKKAEKSVHGPRKSPGNKRSQMGSYFLNTDPFAIAYSRELLRRSMNRFFSFLEYKSSYCVFLMAPLLFSPPDTPAREIIESAIQGKPILFHEGRKYSILPSLSGSYKTFTIEEGSLTLKVKF